MVVRHGHWSWALLLLAGVLQAISIAWPWGLGWGLDRGQASGVLQLLSMALAIHVVTQSTTAQQAALKIWVFATAWLVGSFWWLFVSMHQYGGLPSWAATLAVLALACALSLYYAAAGAVYWRWRGQKPLWSAAVFAAAWTLAELARGQWLTGFPWGAIGYAHVDLWGQWMHWVGVYGVGAAAAWVAAAMALTWVRGQRAGMLTWASLLVLMAAWSPSTDHTQPSGHMSVWLLQGNIQQDQKFNNATGVAQALQWYPSEWVASLTAPQPPDLVVAPETAVPMPPQHIDERWWRDLLQNLAEQVPIPNGSTVHWMTGLPLGSAKTGYSNSAWGVGAEGSKAWLNASNPSELWDPGAPNAYRYDKHHLVPMGEFIPPLFRWFTEWMNIPLGDFNRGALVQAPWQIGGQRVAAHICFEDVFGEELAQTIAASDPTVLVNLSNLAWFGGTVALDQHLNIARVRAMELGRPIVRATNTGSTAHIDHLGRVVAQLPHQTRARLVTRVEGRTGQTPYVAWVSRWGLLPLWLGATLVLCLAIGLRRPRPAPGP